MEMRGFRYEHTRPDADAPGGQLKLKILVVAPTWREAVEAVIQVVPQTGLELIEVGDHVLVEARGRGIADHQAVVI
jgi:hypothetical protein